jgi:hypothetical protein
VKTTETKPTRLREGWNLLVRKIGGVNRTFFVFGDTTVATFRAGPDSRSAQPRRPQNRLHPRGSVLDNSFGRMNFKRKFKTSTSPASDRRDGVTRFINLRSRSRTSREHGDGTVEGDRRPQRPTAKGHRPQGLRQEADLRDLVALLGFRDLNAA